MLPDLSIEPEKQSESKVIPPKICGRFPQVEGLVGPAAERVGRASQSPAETFGVDLCSMYRYTIHGDQELPASGRGEVFPHGIEGWDSAETREQAALAIVCSRQCQAAGRLECSGMEAASAGRGAQGSLGDQRQRELAPDV